MTFFSDYFARVEGRVNLRRLRDAQIVVVGVGTVGSQIAYELANCGVGRLLLIDGDLLETSNLSRHVLPGGYVGMNKAEAMALYLDEEVPGLRVSALPRNINDSLSDAQVDALIGGADLLVAATDDRSAQRRLGRRALALTVPASFPALYPESGGEVIVQLHPALPCFLCWDGYRPNEAQLRGVAALNVSTLPLIQLAVRLSLGLLDPDSTYADLMIAENNEPPFQVFVQERDAPLDRAPLMRRPNCPSCAVGPPRRTRAPRPTPRTPPPTAPSYRVPSGLIVTPSAPQPSERLWMSVDDIGSFIVGAIVGLFLWCLAVYIVLSILFGESTIERSTSLQAVTIALYVAPVPIAIIVGLVRLVRQINDDR